VACILNRLLLTSIGKEPSISSRLQQEGHGGLQAKTKGRRAAMPMFTSSNYGVGNETIFLVYLELDVYILF
jgi:hypothetical protein